MALIGNLLTVYALNFSLGEEGFGEFSLATRLIGTMSILFGLSLSSILLEKGSALLAKGKHEQARELAGQLFWLQASIACIGSCLIWMCQVPLMHITKFAALPDWLWMILILNVTTIMFTFYSVWYEINLNVDKVIIQNHAARHLYFLVGLGAIIGMGLDTKWVAVAYTVTGILILVPWIISQRFWQRFRVYHMSLEDMKFCGFSLSSNLMLNLLYSVDVFMLNYMHDARHVADYQIALKFGILSIIMYQIVEPVLQSLTTRLFHLDEYQDNIKKIVRDNIVIFGGFWALFMLVFGLVGKTVLSQFGAYETLTPLVVILGNMQLLSIFFSIPSTLLVLKRYTGALLRNAGLALCVNIGINIVLIPTFGTYGAAISTWVATSMLFLHRIVLIKNRFGLRLYREMLAYSGLSIGMLSIVILDNAMLAILLLVGCVGLIISQRKTLVSQLKQRVF